MRRRTTAKPRAQIALWVGGVIVAVFVVLAIIASFFHSAAYVARPENPFMSPFWQTGGSLSHPLGTDSLGRDVAARLLFGIRISVEVAVASVVIAGVVGLAIGVIAGFVGGWLDDLVMRVCDGLLAIPVILLAISVIGAVGASLGRADLRPGGHPVDAVRPCCPRRDPGVT